MALRGTSFGNVTTKDLIQQIETREKAKKKLPTWFSSEGIYYPPKLNLEQTSSEVTAKYKARLVQGKSIIDITGGFGVDSYYFSKEIDKVTHCEENTKLSEIAKHNFKQLGGNNIQTIAGDGLKCAIEGVFDIIYVDPSRRHESKGKVFFLSDCAPDIPKHLDRLLASCDVLLLKTSPMLDISVGLSELYNVEEVHIVAVDNEVKELLWLMTKNSREPLKIKTINHTKSGLEEFSFEWNGLSEATYSLPLTYLYEPNAAIMKSGAFQHVSEVFGLGKLHINTHLYTSDALIDFPGRRFKIEKVIPYSKKDMREVSRIEKANISTRNFPQAVGELRKKWKLKDGGLHYLFFTTNKDDEKCVLLCKKT